jgi:hypothetical protein
MSNFWNGISSAAQGYPFKTRVVFAFTTCLALLISTLNWKFEPSKTIAICSFTVACFFDRKGKWWMLFLGIGIGDLMLYVSR